MYTDVHCHLNFSDYGNIEETVNRFRKSGVEVVITSGFDLSSGEECRRIAGAFDLYFSAGWQPQELNKMQPGDMDALKKLCLDSRCVAVGEIGLDYHYPDNPDKDFQKEVFLEELELADELSLPVVIHSRDCAEDMLSILKDNKNKLKNGGVLHCYSHSAEMVKDFLNLGFYFSFGGTATFKGAKKVARSVIAVPEDRILSETDSPYLTPEPKRGIFPNTPENIPYIVKRLAEIRGEEEEKLASAVLSNAKTLFKKIK